MAACLNFAMAVAASPADTTKTTPLAQPQIRVGYFDLPPHTQLNAGANANTAANTANGPALQYFSKVASRMQLEPSFELLPLARLVQQLAENKLDAALILARNPERERLGVQYPTQPFYIGYPALLQASTVATTPLEPLLQNPAIRLGSWHYVFWPAALQHFAGQRLLLSGDDIPLRALEMFRQQKLDLFYSPDHYALHYMQLRAATLRQQDPQQPLLTLIHLPGAAVPLYTAFSPQGARRFMQAYQQALADEQQQQSYSDFLAQQLRLPHH